MTGKFAGLLPGSSDHDALAEERAGFVPIELLAKSDHIPDDGDGWRGELGFAGDSSDGREGAFDAFLPSGRAPADHGNRGFRGHSLLDQFLGDLLDSFDPHEDDFGSGSLGDGRPIDVAGRLGWVLVARDHHEAGTGIAVSDRDAGVIGNGDGGRDAGDDLEGDTGLGEFLGFFAAAPKHIGIAPLEADDSATLASLLDEQLVQILLGNSVLVGTFPGVKDLGGARCVTEQVCVHQGVVDNDLSLGEKGGASEGEESGISGASTNEINDT